MRTNKPSLSLTVILLVQYMYADIRALMREQDCESPGPTNTFREHDTRRPSSKHWAVMTLSGGSQVSRIMPSRHLPWY